MSLAADSPSEIPSDSGSDLPPKGLADFLPETPAPLATHRDPPPDIAHDVSPEFLREFPPTPFVKPPRLASLDVFRGITIAFMLLVNNAGNDHQYTPLEHADWHGWTPTDLVFPFFLFIVGVAIPFSLASRRELVTRGQLLGRIWIRALSLVMLGMTLRAVFAPAPWLTETPDHLFVVPDGFYFTKALRWIGFVGAYVATFALLIPWRSKRLALWLPIAIAILYTVYCIAMHFVRAHALAAGWPKEIFGGNIFNPDMLRIPGVLQRIGLCYGVAATVALFVDWRSVLLAAIALCCVYVVLMTSIKVEGHKLGSFSKEDNFARTVDVAVFERSHINDVTGKREWTQKHTYNEYPDNEGLVSTLPAIATSLFGILAGLWLRSPRTAVERCAGLLAMSGPVIFLGIVLDHALMPINKNLWTPSFSVFCAGMAMLVLGTVFYLCDVQGRRRVLWPFSVMGMNAIAAFAASSLVLAIASNFKRFTPIKGDLTQDVALNTYVNQHLVRALHDASDWLHVHAPRLPEIATVQNESLIYALAFVLAIFVLMWVLYVCRIFVKV